MGLDGSGGSGKFAFLGLFYLYKFEHLWYNGVNKFRIDRAESEGCFLSVGQEDGSRKNLNL